MEQLFLRTHPSHLYHSESYADCCRLPPNLPLPATSPVNILNLTLAKIVYLHQVGQQSALELKMQWWGMEKPHRTLFDDKKGTNARYVICCPMQRLLDYLLDMKVLAIDVTCKGKSIGKAYLNFLVLKGWRGQKYESFMDVKQGRKKIGEISYWIEIISEANPFLKLNTETKQAIQIVPTSNERLTVPFSHQNEQNSQTIIKQNTNSPKEDVIYESFDRFCQFQGEKDEINEQNVAIVKRQQIRKNSLFKKTIKQQPQFQYQEQLKQERHSSPNYQAELVRLAEDFNLLFQKKHNQDYFVNSIDHIIEIEVIKLEPVSKEEWSQVQVILPLPNGRINEYKLGVGGFIKVCIDSNSSREQVIQYLKTCFVKFKGLKAEGSVKLSEVLSKSNEIVQVGLFDRQKKQKQKGVCYLKAIPPHKQNSNIGEANINPHAVQQQHNQNKESQKTVASYILISFKRFNPIEEYQRKINLNIKIYEEGQEQPIGQTKTLWNSQKLDSFKESVTCLIKRKTILFLLFDRQRNDIKMGEGTLTLSASFAIDVEIPIFSKYMGKIVKIGYLSLDFVNNGLNGVTKMRDILSNTNNYELSKAQEQLKNKKNVEDNIVQLIQNHHEINNNNQQRLQQNDNQSNQPTHQQQYGNTKQVCKQQQETVNKIKELIFDRNLTPLQIYNKFFTFLYQNPSLVQHLSQRYIKITDFLQAFKQISTKKILFIKQLNYIISQNLSSPDSLNSITQIDLTQLKQSYDAFCTYYEEVVEERDNMLRELLEIMERIGVSINDLEFELKSNQKIWEKLNQFLSFGKGQKINIVEAIKQHYEAKNVLIKSVTGSQFCDILRRFQVYETTLGQEVKESKLSFTIYERTCQLLVTIEPYIMQYSFRQLFQLLQEEEIVMSKWEMLNLEEHLKKVPSSFKHAEFASYEQKYQINKESKEELKKQNVNQLNNKPTIAKSPTFGYLHAPELFKQALTSCENDMVASLDIKMPNLPISPINYQSNSSEARPLKIVFSNLKYPLKELYIEGQSISLQKLSFSKEQKKQSSLQPVQKKYQSSKSEECQIKRIIDLTDKSVDEPSKKEYKSSKSQDHSKNLSIIVEHIQRKFSYQVQVCLNSDVSPINLECVHEEWCSLVGEEGDYLGGILIF